MVTTSRRRREWETAVGRAAVYMLLARSLTHPSADSSDDVSASLAPLLDTLETGDDGITRLVHELLSQWRAPLREREEGHIRLFTHIDPEDCPPYESAYWSEDIFFQTHVMADVAGFYRAHGLRVGGRGRERHDHIGTELEFVAFMAQKEAVALEDRDLSRAAECRATQVAFLRDHLGCWGPGFGRRIALLARHPLHDVAGQLLERFIEADLEAYGIEPLARLDEPRARFEPDDGSCGVSGPGATPVEIRGRR